MNSMPIATVLARDLVAREAQSALPNAPVIPDARTQPRAPRLRGTRSVMASVLHRAADAVAPPARRGTTCGAAV